MDRFCDVQQSYSIQSKLRVGIQKANLGLSALLKRQKIKIQNVKTEFLPHLPISKRVFLQFLSAYQLKGESSRARRPRLRFPAVP